MKLILQQYWGLTRSTLQHGLHRRIQIFNQPMYTHFWCLGVSTVISVRVRRELKEEAERLGIDLRKVVERALSEEISRVKAEMFKHVLEEGLKALDMDSEEWVEAVKESRRER